MFNRKQYKLLSGGTLMLNLVKHHVAEMLETLQEAINQLPNGDITHDEVISFIYSINNILAKESAECASVGEKLIKSLKLPQETIMTVFAEYIDLFNSVPTQYKVLFLPYYESTWDSLESVWEAFVADPMFITQITIMPIRRNTGNGNTTEVYKDYLTPKGIPQVPYTQYDIEKDKPDIVFINQPYDGVNFPQFESTVIKPNVGLLVYIPYYMHFHRSVKEKDFTEAVQFFTELPGHNTADLYITNGSTFMKAYQKYSKNGHKMVALGSPKADYLHKNKNNFPRHPAWEKRIKDRTTFMLNTHYEALTVTDKYNNTTAWLSHLIDYISKDEKLALIWRPHPVTFMFLDNTPEPMKNLLNKLRNGDIPQIILDETENAISAFMYCDAVLSEYSSLITASVYLDKPTFCLNMNPLEYHENPAKYYEPKYSKLLSKTKKAKLGDLTMHTALPSSGAAKYLMKGETVEEMMYRKPLFEFIEAIKRGEDPKAELRSAFLKELLVNLDGKCGSSILSYIKENYL